MNLYSKTDFETVELLKQIADTKNYMRQEYMQGKSDEYFTQSNLVEIMKLKELRRIAKALEELGKA